ncbi:MAG: hypothetical protein M1820_008932 [Bogoriella megaspora]|nr:MAG: hypothetical protein M1820_008932 [Bogoriella megaspora]
MEGNDGMPCLALKGRELVQKYTEELPGRDQLEIAVQSPSFNRHWAVTEARDTSRRKEREQLRQVFLRNDSEETYHNLETEKNRLLNAWRQFQEDLPEQNQKTWTWLKRKRGSAKTQVTQQLKELPVTTFKDVEDTVEKCMESWLKKDRLLGGKASIMHVEVAEEFSKALKELAELLDIVMVEGWIMNVERTRRHTSEVYAKVFEFFRFAMTWWTSGSWTKMRHSLGRGIYKYLQDQIRSIRSCCNTLFQTAQALHLVETRYLTRIAEHQTELIEDLFLKVSKLERGESHLRKLSDPGLRPLGEKLPLLEENERLRQKHDEQQKYSAEMTAAWKSDQAKIGVLMKSGLLDVFFTAMIQEDGRTISRQRATKFVVETDQINAIDESDSGIGSTVKNDMANREWDLDDVLHCTQHLDQYIVGAWKPSNSLPLRNISNESAISRLQQWSSTPASQLLWMIGPPDYSLPSNMSVATVSMFVTAVKLKIPLLSHFCALPPFGKDHREETGMIGVAYDLVRQLLAQLPPIIQTDLDLSAERLSRIDGTVESWKEALSLLGDLLSLFPKPLLVCVIDGLSRLDFRGGSVMCKGFIQVLMGHQGNQVQEKEHRSGSAAEGEAENPGKLFKILLTSSGDSAGLNQIIPMRDRLKVEISNAAPTRDLSQQLSRALAS